MKITILISLVVLCFFEGFSQEKKVYTVKAGETISEVIPAKEIYAFPSFSVGTVDYRSNEKTQGLLNFNILSSEMEFIDASGDTMALAEEPLVRMIVLNKDTFYFSKGYFHLIASLKENKLAKRSVFTTAKIERTGAFDQPMPANIVTYGGMSTGSRIYNLVVRENLTLVKETAYYIGNRNNEFLPATKKNLLKLFPKQERQLNSYFSTNNIDFSNEEALKKVIRFVSGL